jgi:hypothetical protein
MAEHLAMWRCVRFADLGRLTRSGDLVRYRAGIGGNGSWHCFWAEE